MVNHAAPMYCPTCTTTPLVLARRQGVEVDFCPHCRGVWLDRGEQDKLLVRAARTLSRQARAHGTESEGRADGRPRHREDRRRGTWLSAIFD